MLQKSLKEDLLNRNLNDEEPSLGRSGSGHNLPGRRNSKFRGRRLKDKEEARTEPAVGMRVRDEDREIARSERNKARTER